MAKPSRWTRWVITESATPRLPLPWTLARVRRRALALREAEFA